MKKVLILGAGIYQVPLIKKAKEMGLFVVVASYKGNYPGFAIADKVYYEDTTDQDSILEIARLENIDGICTTGTDVAMKTLGRVVDELKLTGISYQAGINTTNKLAMKECFAGNGVTTARYEKIFSIPDAFRVFSDFDAPVIFKAVDSSGSRGIVKVSNISEIEDAFAKVMKVTKYDYFIAEEFLEGIEFGAQAYIYHGNIDFILPHGDIMFQGDAGVPIGHYAPCELPETVISEVESQLIKSIEALKIDNCAINADFILKGDKVYVLEIGARAGATCLPELVSTYYGLDYYEQILNAALGIKPDFEIGKPQPCIVELLISNKSGIITKLENNNELSQNIIDISFDYNVGDEVKAFKVGPDRIGQIIVKGPSLTDASNFIQHVKNNINFKLAYNK